MLRGDTFLLFTLGVILVLLPTPSSAASDLAIENFGYRDVIVTISPDIPPDNANEIIQGIKVIDLKPCPTEQQLKI